MKNQKAADQYNRIYADDDKAFSGEPLPLVKDLSERMSGGDILEVGAGTGRNSLFLASKGFNVLATDISEEGIKRISQKAAEDNTAIQTEVFDIVEKELTREFGAVICTFVFNFMSRQDALIVIDKIQKHTRVGGFSVLTVFTKNGDFFKNNPDTLNFYLDNKEELEGLYKGWKVIKSFEKEGKARAVDVYGNPQFNTFVGFLAQKM